ncbi:hypothetical protein KM915_21150 [Cytobacillus oceanisediminis]|uniref:hypothetical protein n=1 Tax=Cytobacillus oceanisediminis TaxID=665099 RepID=UPI001C23FA5F|nr:hypothetical protein [Cytobacillus oceanisediminis]MBU8732560.1 hypothetical protein [Cytobacillus oceanisediminis]
MKFEIIINEDTKKVQVTHKDDTKIHSYSYSGIDKVLKINVCPWITEKIESPKI